MIKNKNVPNFQKNSMFISILQNTNIEKMEYIDLFEDVTRHAKKIKKGDYLENGIYPIIDQGKNYIGGYTDDEEGLYKDVPCIIFGDHTRVIKYIEKPIFIGADGVKLLKIINANVEPKYLYYLLKNFKVPNTGYNRHFKYIKEMIYPILPIKKQREIINRLELIEDIINLNNEQIIDLENLKTKTFINNLIQI
ncbi:MAG: hypothetical protein ACTHWZ_01725 [Peptoniphilaceae bacterium]